MLSNRTASQPSKFTISILDEAGNKIEATSASWELFDERGVTLTAGAVADFDATADSVTFELDAADLTLPDGVSSAGREIVVTLVQSDLDEIEVRDFFLLVNAHPLTLMENSFITYAEAVRLRSEFGSMVGWDVADRTRQASALAEAYRRLCRMSYRVPGYRNSQDGVGYAAYGTGIEETLFGGNRCRVSTLTLAEFDALPEPFKRALGRAQIAEANVLLGGDPVGDKRQSGIISETVGESSAFFQSKPYLNLPISRQAYEEVKRYVFLGIKIRRG